MCQPGTHAYRHTASYIYCKRCGDIQTPHVRTYNEAIDVDAPPVHRRPQLAPTAPLFPSATRSEAELEQSVQDLEADVVERMREAGVDLGAAFQQAGIDPQSSFARDLMARATGTRTASWAPAAPSLFDNLTVPRGDVGALSPEEQALINRTNQEDPRRVVVEDSDTLDAGL